MKLAKWDELPLSVRQHLQARLDDRKIAYSDLIKLEFWMKTEPDVPDEPWYKDFGTFVLCGNGAYPLTFLSKDQVPHGKAL